MARYHVFLSYSRNDSEFTFRLQEDLEADGLRVWIDRAGIQPGTPSWRKTIEEAIDSSACLLVVLSPDAKESHWVNEELNYAQTLGKRIFYALARGDERTAVPFGHSAAQWIDMRDAALYITQKQQVSDAIFDFLGIDSDTFKAERLKFEEERRRRDREERANRAREEARRMAQEEAAAMQPQSHPRYIEPPSIAPPQRAAPAQRSQLDAVVQGVPGYLNRPAASMQPGNFVMRVVALLIDYFIVALLAALFALMDTSLGSLASIVLWGGYNWYFLARGDGRTPGKRLTGLRVVTMDGGKLSDTQALLRVGGYYVEAFTLGLGVLIAFFNQNRRALHDFLAGTRVIRV